MLHIGALMLIMTCVNGVSHQWCHPTHIECWLVYLIKHSDQCSCWNYSLPCWPAICVPFTLSKLHYISFQVPLFNRIVCHTFWTKLDIGRLWQFWHFILAICLVWNEIMLRFNLWTYSWRDFLFRCLAQANHGWNKSWGSSTHARQKDCRNPRHGYGVAEWQFV